MSDFGSSLESSSPFPRGRQMTYVTLGRSLACALVPGSLNKGAEGRDDVCQ
jgi:hypothetical protein